MEALAKLISSVASLAWPAIFLFLVLKFFEPLKALIESARGRKFTIKVAGNELTMEEASEQQRVIVSDLAQKIAALELSSPRSSQEIQAALANSINSESKRILWVDDLPKNNSLLVATLEERGVTVDIATNSNQGLELMARNKYDAVISDIGRPEGDRAGIDFTRKVRSRDKTTPIYIFCGGWAARNLREETLLAGANEITSSGSTVLALIQKKNA